MTRTAKKRVNVNIDSDLHARATALADQLPGLSFSGLVMMGLNALVPAFERTLEVAKTGDPHALLQVLQLTTAEGMEDAGSMLATLRKDIEKGDFKLDPSKLKK